MPNFIRCINLCVLALLFLRAPSATPQEKSGDIPKIAGQTNWGDVIQRGKFISIAGVETEEGIWDAEGHIRADGKIFLLWTNRDTQFGGPGIYEWLDGELVGTWGYFGEVRIDEGGALVGDIAEDVIYRRD